MNRVIEWGRGGIAIEADQRHVREMLKDPEMERANHLGPPCAVEGKKEGNARSESKRENRCDQGQTQTKHQWDDMCDGDGRNSPQMAGDDATDRGHITKYRALVARTSYLSQARPFLKFAPIQACCAMANPSVRDMECVQRIGRHSAGRPGSAGSRLVSWGRALRTTPETFWAHFGDPT